MKNLLIVLTFLASSCAYRNKILDVPMVSMTHSNVPKGAVLVEKGNVTGNYCASKTDTGNIGLIDEAISNAQKNANVDFISNASFHFESGEAIWHSTCMHVEGTGVVIKK